MAGPLQKEKTKTIQQPLYKQAQKQEQTLANPQLQELTETVQAEYAQPEQLQAAEAPVMEEPVQQQETASKETRSQERAKRKEQRKQERRAKKAQAIQQKKHAATMRSIDKYYKQMIAFGPCEEVEGLEPTELFADRAHFMLKVLLDHVQGKNKTVADAMVAQVQSFCKYAEQFDRDSTDFRMRVLGLPNWIEHHTKFTRCPADIENQINMELFKANDENMNVKIAKKCDEMDKLVFEFIGEQATQDVVKNKHALMDESQQLFKEQFDSNQEMSHDQVRTKIIRDAMRGNQ